MPRPLVHLLCGAALLGGCSNPTATTGKGEPAPAEAPSEPAPTTAKPAPTATKPAPSAPHVAATELPTIEITAAPQACPELPALPRGASEARRGLVPYAAAIRRLACEPALYGLTTAALAAELGLPPAAEVGFSGPRTTTLQLPEGITAGDIAAVFGVAKPQVHVTWQAYHALTHLGTDPNTGDFALYGPGRVNLSVDFEVDRYGDDAGKEKALPAPDDAAIDRGVYIGMPASALRILPDADAVPLVVSALDQLAAAPEILALDPAEAQPRIGLGGERYRVARVSLHAGEVKTDGLSFDPRRTVLPAKELAAALGLANARAENVNREHRVWEIEVLGSTTIHWRGLELSIRVEAPDTRERTVALDGLEVGFLSILPAG